MQTTELTPESISLAATAIPENTPFVMLNLLRYKVEADYGRSTGLHPCSGREAYYKRYVPAFAEVAGLFGRSTSFRPILVGSVLAHLVAPVDELWDDLVLVEYTDFAAFRAVVESPEYRRIADPHRRAALADWRLLATSPQPMG